MKQLYNYDKLKGRIKEILGTLKKFSNAINITDTALNNKLTGKNYFNQDQIEKSIEVLKIEIDEIPIYFFTKKVE